MESSELSGPLVGFSHHTGGPAGSEQRDLKEISGKGTKILRLGSAIGCVLAQRSDVSTGLQPPPLNEMVALALTWLTYGVPGGVPDIRDLLSISTIHFTLALPDLFHGHWVQHRPRNDPARVVADIVCRRSIPFPSPRPRTSERVRISTWKFGMDEIDNLSSCLTASSRVKPFRPYERSTSCVHTSSPNSATTAAVDPVYFDFADFDRLPSTPSLRSVSFPFFLLPSIEGDKSIQTLSHMHWSDDPISDM